MPELPDITIYVEHLERRVLGTELRDVRVVSPNLLRSFEPPLESTFGRRVREVRRIGKRIAVGLDDDLWLVLHLMIAGRLHWGVRAGKLRLATFEFTAGTLTLTEASTKKRASLHVVRGEAALKALDPGGVEPLDATAAEFRAGLARVNHTLKRALTDPKLISGIGNAYSDEILHRAKLSPMRRTNQLTEDEWTRLYATSRQVLGEWIERLRAESGDTFPEKVTAFREGMAVHGRYQKPCPVCGAPVQRIVYAENEANYCARCQTGGRRLADRALSRLLKGDWPRRIEDVEGDEPTA
jgi:formamidopyrimidine-DNA glycosylase